jgi:hypothetical protein
MNNIISVGLDGTFTQTGKTATIDRDIDRLFDDLSKSNNKKIVLYFHGGLVNEDSGRKQAEFIANFFMAEADTIAFVWKTGFREIFQQKIELIQQSNFQKLQEIVSRYTHDRLDKGGKGSSSEDIENAREDICKQLDLDSDFYDLLKNFDSQEIPKPEVENIKNTETDVEKTKGVGGILTSLAVAKLIINIVRRHQTGRDHGLYPTIIEEIFRAFYLDRIGGWVWGRMKNTAKGMWRESTTGAEIENTAIGTYFLAKLSSFQVAHPDVTIDTVGHSAGSIAICHLIDAISDRLFDLKIRNVLFLAPACTSDLFHTHIVGKQHLYQNFRMFTMTDESEQQDVLVKGIYPRSLLYLISGVLEDEADTPIAGMKFHIGEIGSRVATNISFQQYPNDDSKLRDINNFLSKNNRLVLSPTPAGAAVGLSSKATSHGDFGKIEEEQNPATAGTTLKSLRSIISN